MKLKYLKYYIILIQSLVFANNGNNIVSVNQLGYLPNAEKYFITNNKSDHFELVSKVSNETVFKGSIELLADKDISTGMRTYKGIFTDFNIPGNYYIKLENGLSSHPFSISDNVFDEALSKVMHSYYLQRCGMDLDKKYAGKFAHKACHILDAQYHPSCNKEGIKDVDGGWHDAGDYGKYSHNTAVTLHLMLLGYQLFPDRYASDETNINESGNGIPDFLDEVRFQLDWLLKMQDEESGAVHYMINTQNYTWTMPQRDSAIRYIYGVASVSTGGFAAITAMASRIYESYDKDFSEKLLDASKFAWRFLERNPNLVPKGGYLRPKDTNTGGYAGWPDGNDDDERLWAAVELFITTGDDHFHKVFDTDIKNVSDFDDNFSWGTVYVNAKMSYMLSDKKFMDTSIQKKISQLFIKRCDLIIEDINKDGFHSALKPNEYVWGATGDLLSRGVYLIVANILTGNEKYYNAALCQLNHTLGLNGNNISFVGKVGANSVQKIHHAQLATDGVHDIFPGLLSGGPNKNIEDPFAKSILDKNTPPALCFVDNVESYSTNECCIFYSAPLVFVAGYFAKDKKTDRIKNNIQLGNL